MIETPDSQFNRGFQYTISFDRFLTNLSIVYHVEMLVIQCFWTIQSQSQPRKNIFVFYTITIDSNGYLHSIHNTNRIESNNGIHSRSLPLYSCLFNITILWDYPVQSSSFTWLSRFNRYQSTEWLGITQFYFEHWIKFDCFSFDLRFLINSTFSFFSSITQRIGTC